MQDMKIVIIGGGASGLTAAISAAERGASVTVLECGSKPARKIYATGNGRCNLTNTDMDMRYYRSADMELPAKTIQRFGYKDTMHFFGELGMMFKNRNGYIYPSTGQAATVAEILVSRCLEAGVEIRCSTRAMSVRKDRNRFKISCETDIRKENREAHTERTEETADRLILAAGSTAGGFGCGVTGAELAASLGHKIIPLVPALTALRCQNRTFFRMASGVRIDARVSLVRDRDGEVLSEETGELQLTDYGISGIPVFQVSRYAGYELKRGEKISALMEFLPEYHFQALWDVLGKTRAYHKNRSVLEAFSCIFHTKLVKGMLLSMGVSENRKMAELKDGELKKILGYFKQFRAEVTGTNDMKNAQVCAGGVSTRELTEDFMSKKVKNLYIIGETVDVDGVCGGYNLQFAWASGRIAGLAASKNNR